MTPLQYINAIEAMNFYGLKNNILLVIYPINRKNIFDNIIEVKYWDKILFFEREEESLLNRNITKYFKWLNRCKEFIKLVDELDSTYKYFDKLLIGNYIYETMLHIGNRLNSGEIILLDDGNATIDIANFRIKGIQIFQTKRYSIKSKFRVYIKKLFFNYLTEGFLKVTYFTIYDIPILNDDKINKNPYKYIKSFYTAKKQKDIVFFLGGSLVENNIVKIENYFRFLLFVRQYFTNYQIEYIKHPGEHLIEIEKFLKMNEIIIVKPDLPFELYLMKLDKHPKIISGFLSTALINVSEIYGSIFKYILFEIPDGLIAFNRRVWAKNIYNNFHKDKNKFDLIKIE